MGASGASPDRRGWPGSENASSVNPRNPVNVSFRPVRVAGLTDELVTEVVNALDAESHGFDVVIAIGVLDYHADFPHALRTLLRRTKPTLIVNIPRIDHPRNWLRYAWFALCGVDFQLASLGRIRRTAASCAYSFDIEQGPYEWFLRINVASYPVVEVQQAGRAP